MLLLPLLLPQLTYTCISGPAFLAQDVFDPSVTLLNPGSSDILLDSSAVGPGIPAGGQLDLSFLGTHDLQASGGERSVFDGPYSARSSTNQIALAQAQT